MGFDAFNKAETEYRHAVRRLTRIAADVRNSDRSLFLKRMADAWLQADPSNKRILRPTWSAFVVKYGLNKKTEKTLGQIFGSEEEEG